MERDVVRALAEMAEHGVEHGSVTAPKSVAASLPPQPFRKPFALAHAGADTEPTTGCSAPTTSPTTPEIAASAIHARSPGGRRKGMGRGFSAA